MIAAKEMIKTHHILSVGWSLSIGKTRKKSLNKSAAITEAICQMCLTKWESTESTSSERFFYVP